MMIDVAKARRETPGCELVLHLNNAGAALMPQPVVDAVRSHLEREAAIGGYEAAAEAEERLDAVYDSVAALLGCHRDEVAITENATRAWDMAFYSLPLGAGDRILTSMAEYASNYIAYLQVTARTGATVEVVPNDEHGQASVAALEQALDERVKLISITHVPTNGGLVNPVAEIGKVARAAGVPYLLDACQSAGQMPVDVEAIGCDILSATSRKYLRGPRGAGFLYVRRSLIEELEPPFLDLRAAEWTAPDEYRLRSDARRFENWESPSAVRLGLGVAVDYALGWGLSPTYHWIQTLADVLRSRLGEIPGVEVLDLGLERCGIVSFNSERVDPEGIKQALAEHSINVETSDRSSTLLDMKERGLTSVVRASVHYYNTEEEIERFCGILTGILR